MTRGLGEGSVRQAPCNIYQLSSSREEKEERGKGVEVLSLPLQKPVVDVFKLPLMLQTLSHKPKKLKQVEKEKRDEWFGVERTEL